MATLQEIREKLKALEEQKGSGNTKAYSQSLVYPFWNIDVNSSVELRFLPDGGEDEDNPFFWKERQLINLKFPGVLGGDENKEVTLKVPCIEMWGDTCPVHTELRAMFKDPSLEDLAKQYWKKRTFILQGFVNDNPIAEDAADAPENPIRRFNLGPQIFNIVKDSLLDPDMTANPVDYINGVDFRITRTKKGNYNDYSTSKWSRRETGLTVEQLEAIEKFGLFALNDWMPKRPTPEGLNAIFEMFEASLAGELYDPEKWAKYYRPWGLEWEGDTENTTETTENKTVELAAKVSAAKPGTADLAGAKKLVEQAQAQADADDEDEEPTVEVVEEVVVEKVEASAPEAVSSTSAQAILEKIRARANN